MLSTAQSSKSILQCGLGSIPEQEFLSFDVSTVDLQSDVAQLVQHIKQVAETILFHWKSFPVLLPTPVAVYHETPLALCSRVTDSGISTENGGSTSGCLKPIVLRDVFVTPSFDELDAVAVDTKGDAQKLSPLHLNSIKANGLHQGMQFKRHKLNEYQLEMLQNSGEFEVPSLHFPGQTHRWRVAECLQQGRERTHEKFLDDLAFAAALIIITAKNRCNGRLFSIRQAGNAIWAGCHTLLDLLFGIQWVQAHNLEARIKEERCNYLVQELTAKDGDVEGLCSWILQQVERATREKFRVCSNTKEPYVPYMFSTPQGQDLNLKLFNRELMRKIIPVLVSTLERESRGWFLHFREKIVSQLKTQGLSDSEIEKDGNKLVQEEYLKRIFAAIESSEALLEFGEDVPNLLIDQAKAVLLMHQSVNEVEKIYAKGEKSEHKNLSRGHPILSRISVWLQDRLSATHDTLTEEHKWRPHEHALALCRQDGLSQYAYFLQRDLAFMREREPVLLKELRNVKVAMRVFQWRTQIWFPVKYVVRRSLQGESEIIPTVVAGASTSITTPRSDPNQPVYLLEKQVVCTTSTRWPCWRWMNLVYRSWTWTCNALFFFAVWLPLCSPISLRALCSVDPFMADFELSQVNGTVCPSKASLTPTLYSRLSNLWRHISKSRTHFETMPDTGFIGKGVSRHMNRLWNYLLKGILGTLVLVTVFPVLCIVTSLGSLAIALMVPVLGPASVVIIHIFFIIVYDFDSPSPEGKWCPLVRVLLWDFLSLGVLQPIFALVFALFICPVLAVFFVLFSLLRRGLRHIWDEIMFHCVIKKIGRVPASDSILVKRIAGPGLHDNFVYQISCEQALAAFEARLELDELAVFEKEMELSISKPVMVYNDFVHNCFEPFSCIIGSFGNFERLEKEAKDLTQILHNIVERRKMELDLGLDVSVKSKIKMTMRDLKVVLKEAVVILEEFYPSKILSKVVRRPSSESASQQDDRQRSRDSELLQEINTLLHQGMADGALPSPENLKLYQKEAFESVEAWWDARGLSVDDTVGLTTLIFSEIFHPDFLTPLEDSDTVFQMEAQGINLSRYTEMMRCTPDRADLDEKLTVHMPRGNIQIQPPYLDLSAFTPLVRHSVPTDKTEKTSLAARLSLRLNPGGKPVGSRSRWVPEKLLIPPPVPHPAKIAVIIHNRDASNAIALEDNLTRQVLRTIEDSSHSVPSLSIDLDGDASNTWDSLSSSSGDFSSYDDDPMSPHRTSRGRRRRRRRKRSTLGGNGRSRMATLEMTETLERAKSDATSKRGSSRRGMQERVRPSMAESLHQRSSGLLSSPLRALFEGQRPFSVAINLAAAEDESLPTDDDEDPDCGSSSFLAGLESQRSHSTSHV